jgi:hypothetical protein
MKEIITSMEIATSEDRVWEILTDFPKYSHWNPFIQSISGKAEVGKKILVKIKPPGARGMTFKPIVLTVSPKKELRWKGNLIIPGLFDGEHQFIIEKINQDRVKFIQREKFSGLLAPLFSKSLDANTRQGFEDMNKALKDVSEKHD